MSSSGLLLLTIPISQLVQRVGFYLRKANKTMSQTLYIIIDPNLASKKFNNHSLITRRELMQVVPRIYVEASREAPLLDVRVLHPPPPGPRPASVPTSRTLQYSPEIILTNQTKLEEEFLRKYLSSQFNLNIEKIEKIICEGEVEDRSSSIDSVQETQGNKIYDNVCIGGTFDLIHNGHKVLFSSAQLRCEKSLTIGVTDMNMIKSKTLWELIQPVEKRIEIVKKFVNDVDPFIDYKITAIQDPFGPAIEDGNLQCIVVSQETVRGGTKINEIRKEKGLKILEIEIVDLVNEKENGVENKLSSSTLRMRKLKMDEKTKEAEEPEEKASRTPLKGMPTASSKSLAERMKTDPLLQLGVLTLIGVAAFAAFKYYRNQ